MQVGFSGGARSKPSFHWARNLLSKTHDLHCLKTFDYSCSSAFALLWNMCSSRLPPSIIDDFNTFLNTTRITRLSNSSDFHGIQEGSYSVPIGDEVVEFKSAELAPPVGFFGMDYARYFLFLTINSPVLIDIKRNTS